MTRLGTCRHAVPITNVWHRPTHRQPHEPAETAMLHPEQYNCGWIDSVSVHPPPPIERWGFELRAGDCEACRHYAPAGAQLLARVLAPREREMEV